jgi:ABC-type transport system involved in cytochrome c biogenesis permease component
MCQNFKKILILTNFFLHDLKFSGQNVVLLFILIFIQMMFVFGNINIIKEYFLVINFILLNLVIIQAFDHCLEQDINDGSLDWILSQRLSELSYFLARSFAFIGVVLLPLIVFVVSIWCWQQNAFPSIIFLFLALLLGGIQVVLLSGSLSLSLLFRQQGFHLSLPLCLLPLQLPTLIILRALETNQINPFSALFILFGLCLLTVTTTQVIVKKSFGKASNRFNFFNLF